MKLTFAIDYRTASNQGVCISGQIDKLGSADEKLAVPMSPGVGGRWELEVEVNCPLVLSYRYCIKDHDTGTIQFEFGAPRQLDVNRQFERVQVRDFWRPRHALENPLYCSPFHRALFARKGKSTFVSGNSKNSHIRFQLRAPRVGPDYQMAIIGSSSFLGEWDENKVLLMSDEDYPVWKVDVLVDDSGELLFEYKYVIYSHKENRIVTWEEGENRRFPVCLLNGEKSLIVHTDEFFRYPVGNWKCAGVAVPVFSIRSKDSAGVGEFTGIKSMVDWAVKTGLKLIQILPVNDTVATHTWKDSYPYAAISVDALHPVYADLDEIGPLRNKQIQQEIEVEKRRLNALDQVDYEGVMALKSRFFKLSYDENKGPFLKSKSFKNFFKANKHWLMDYAAFSYFRDRYQTCDFNQWGEHARLSDEELERFVSDTQNHYDDVAVHYYIQYHLDKQLREASEYARQHGVVLKGDIPIGIYRYSVEAWRLPHLFNMDGQSGAPPDDFSVEGQNWGFPTYNWEEMSKDDFHWWRDRLVKMSDYFDVFRIDHILGFFRIWEIPLEAVQGLLGHFNPALPFHIDDFKEKGIRFDEQRFCRPYIKIHMIHEIFGTHADEVLEEYLDQAGESAYQMKSAFDTQRKVWNWMDQKIKNHPHRKEHLEWLRSNLCRLHTEVLFMKALPSDEQYHPRIGFHSTYTYRELDPETQRKLDEMYIHYFYHRHNAFWRNSAMQKLPVLKQATDMLICGEDLGMVPASVPGVMDELQILSLAIQRMPNDDREFWHPQDTPYMSVTSTGSHDMSTLREWWEENPDRTQRFYNQILGCAGDAPSGCGPEVAARIIDQHLHAPGMLAIFPLQDLLAMDGKLRRNPPEAERINVPDNPNHYWRYRFHINMENLLREERFNDCLKRMIDQGGRSADY